PVRVDEVHRRPGRPLPRPGEVEGGDERADRARAQAALAHLRRDGDGSEAEGYALGDIEKEKRRPTSPGARQEVWHAWKFNERRVRSEPGVRSGTYPTQTHGFESVGVPWSDGCARMRAPHAFSSVPTFSTSFSMLNGFLTKSSAPAARRSSISSWFTTPLMMMIRVSSNSGLLLIVWQTTLPLMSGSM